MRADRLVSILMLLQSRGRVPAPELAETLGVSVRTIYRDMDALSTSGIPAYTERGAEGGCCLVEDYRTDLTGLNEDEAHALFLLTAPGPLDLLEVGQKMRSALRKLAASLPGYLENPQQTSPRVHLDWTAWGAQPSPGEHLGMLYRAIQHNQRVRLAYRMWGEIEIEQSAVPLGLVAKTGEWYLAWENSGKLHWQRVADLRRVTLTGQHFDFPPEFDLLAAWQDYCAGWERDQALYLVQARALPEVIGDLRRRTGVMVKFVENAPDASRRQRVELAFRSLEAARQVLMGLGRGVEVLSPAPLRLGIIDFARQITRLYEIENDPQAREN